jgi:anti-sigma regulatory factor (Ser/Thr protein kinase)
LSRADELTIGVSGAEARRAAEWLEAACRAQRVPGAPVDRLALCLHEVLANIIAHGGGPAHAAPIRLLLDVRRDADAGEVSVTVSDAGAAFNPLTVPQKVAPQTLGEASAGGLGLVMIRRCADWLDYRRADERNHFTFGARWSPP